MYLNFCSIGLLKIGQSDTSLSPVTISLTLNPPLHILAKKVECVHKITLWTNSFLSPTRRTRSDCLSLLKYLHVVNIIPHMRLKLSCLLLVCFRVGHDAVLRRSNNGARLRGGIKDEGRKREYIRCRRRESCSEGDVSAGAKCIHISF